MVLVHGDTRIVIVGAGCFGLSTGYHLLKRGYKDVTILDRSPVLPAPDAASTDISKIVRSSYADIFYTRLGREAIAAWKETDEWGDTYRECGVYCATEGADSYIAQAYQNDITVNADVQTLLTPEAIRNVFPTTAELGLSDAAKGFLNRDGGWAFASQGIQRLMDKVAALGGKIIPGKTVSELTRTNKRVSSVRCTDGSVHEADLVILAAGSWSASSFPDLGLDGQCLATGQTVAFVQLTSEEAERYRACPVYLDFHSGFYVFPPNKDNIVKCAIHSGGFVQKIKIANSDVYVSTPRTVTSDGVDGLRIPRAALKALRTNLARIYPEIGSKPFFGTRLCWYTDSADDNWVIGAHPEIENVFLATSGCGHAFKFLPVIGRLVADAIEGKLPPELVKKFAPGRAHEHDAIEPSIRLAPPANLVLDELCTPEDLLPV
ncbi:FAD dependent oxidoreductase [Dichomitus squalens]|uniref:FAD dependent oxidoreductase n=1 Tax=Dichomitus squalens TaxID=114155 RepID=A0A4Q9PXZ7_9APHY|nr:FAD dependent oxidoreductase [Dichomitus squalens]TBU59627.1 FAD dependent oxidoreductase [Dichomitus squalens]